MNITVIVLIILTFASRIIGLGREIILAYFYGASNISDAYLISLTIPTVILGFIAAGINTGYIPIYQKLKLEKKSETFTNQVVNFVLILCTLIFIVSMIFTPQLVWSFASGFDAETLSLTVTFTRITLVSVFFVGVSNILQGYLQVNQKFYAASLVGIPFNIVIMTFIVISYKYQIYFLAIGSVLAIFSQVIYLYILAHRNGYRYAPKLDLKDKNIRQMVYLALPIIIGNSAEQIDRLVDKTLASQYGPGGISAVSYASRTLTAIQGIFIASVLTVLYPKIAGMAAKKDIEGMKQSISEAIVGVSLFILPATIGIMIFSKPVITLLFGRGAFDDQAVAMTASILFFYIPSMFGSGIQNLLARAFYSLQDTKTPMINATIAIVLNIIFNLIFAQFMGITGLALANSLAAFVSMLLMWRSLHKKIGALNLRSTLWSLTKILIASGIMGGIAYTVYHFVSPLSNTIALFSAVVVGILIYGIIILLMKFKEVEILLAPLKSKFLNK